MAIKLSDLAVGDTITIKNGALDYNTNGKYQSWVYGYTFQIIQVGKSTDKEYIVFGINGVVTGAVKYTNIDTHKSKGGSSKTNDKKKDTPDPNKKNSGVPDPKSSDNAAASSQAKDKVDTSSKNITPTQNQGVIRGSKSTNATAVAYTAATEDPYLSQSIPRNDVSGDVITPTNNDSGNTVDKQNFIRPSNSSYPRAAGTDLSKGNRRIYDYATNPSFASSKLGNIHEKHNIFTTDRSNVYHVFTENYNRYKIQNPNLALTTSFAHVFFTRPDLNILLKTGANTFSLTDSAQSDPEIYTAYRNNPDMVKQLIMDNGMSHKFMFSLSNAVGSFSASDEGLKTDTAGETWTGHKIAYGKHNIDGRTASQFQISYTDGRNLDIYHINKLWMDYISKVYRGQLRAKGQVYDQKSDTWKNSVYDGGLSEAYIEGKILDYASSVYYILCAEDGETIIFWSKYFGVFPVNSPSSAFSWSNGNKLHNPQLDIPYMYSFKRDYNPFDLVAFNKLGADPNTKDDQGNSAYKYSKIYDSETMGAGRTLVGAPFIETIADPAKKSEAYQFKLRFRTRGNSSMYVL